MNVIMRLYRCIYNIFFNTIYFWISINEPNGIFHWIWEDIKYWVIKEAEGRDDL